MVHVGDALRSLWSLLWLHEFEARSGDKGLLSRSAGGSAYFVKPWAMIATLQAC